MRGWVKHYSASLIVGLLSCYLDVLLLGLLSYRKLSQIWEKLRRYLSTRVFHAPFTKGPPGDIIYYMQFARLLIDDFDKNAN